MQLKGKIICVLTTSAILAHSEPVVAREVVPTPTLPPRSDPAPATPPREPVVPRDVTGCFMQLEVTIGPRGLPAGTRAWINVWIAPNAPARSVRPSRTFGFRAARAYRAGEIQIAQARVDPCFDRRDLVESWIVDDEGHRPGAALEAYTGYTRMRILYLIPGRACVIFNADRRYIHPREDLGLTVSFAHFRPADCVDPVR